MTGWLQVAIGASAVALGTWIGDWYVPAIWGAVAGALWAGERPARHAAIAAALGWGVLLMLPQVLGAPVAALAARLAGALHLPVWGLVAATLALPALLAGSAARVSALFVAGRRAPLQAPPGTGPER